MNYSNPTRYFIDGNKEVLFVFKPRKNPVLFYVQVRTKRYIPISIIIPAADQKDAKDLLRKAMEFKIKCSHEYIKNIEKGRAYTKIYKESEMKEIEKTELIIDSINGTSKHYEIIIEKVRLDQFFKVGWALNDII